MRLALLSDIHGNLPALELVLADLQAARADQAICLGDVASLGPQPREVVARLKQLAIPIIMGNHDQYLLEPERTEKHHPWLRAMEMWCLAQLTPDDLDFMRSFKPQLSVALDAQTTALCYHGSPHSNEEWIYPTTLPAVLDEIFANQTAHVFIGGHTHVQMWRPHRNSLILNPGSVGMPFEFPMPGKNQHTFRRAEYALLDLVEGKLTVTLQQLPVDFTQIAQIARASGLPDVEFWLASWDV